VAPFRSQLLGVIQPNDPATRIQDNGCSHHWTKQRAASGFIQSGDTLPPMLAGVALVARATKSAHRPRILTHAEANVFHKHWISCEKC
jgi:hypothetical protein